MSTTQASQTEVVFSHHLQALSSRASLDEILQDYSDESVIFTQNGPVRGLAGIRVFFEAFVASLTPEVLGNFQILRLDFEGAVAYLVFTAKPLASLGTDTFVLQSGKIAIQTFTILG